MLQSGISWASWYFQNTKTGAKKKKNITRNGPHEMWKFPMKLTMVSLVFYGVFKILLVNLMKSREGANKAHFGGGMIRLACLVNLYGAWNKGGTMLLTAGHLW